MSPVRALFALVLLLTPSPVLDGDMYVQIRTGFQWMEKSTER